MEHNTAQPEITASLQPTASLSKTVIFNSVEKCSEATGIPYDVLVFARDKINALSLEGKDVLNGAKGFQYHRIYWTDELKKWIEENRSQLEQIKDTQSREYWLTRRDAALAIKAELDKDERLGQLVEKEAVKAALKTIAAAQCSLLNAKIGQELAVRVNGKTVADTLKEFDKVLNEVFNVMQKGISAWS